MLRRWLVGGLSVVLLASALLAKPGVVTNRQGETFTGDVTEDDKETEITINPCPKKGSGRISPNVRFTYLNASGS